MVPESKAHLVQANRAVTGKQPQFEQVEDDSESLGLKDGFDWYMKPQDKAKYDQIYLEARDMRGDVSCTYTQFLGWRKQYSSLTKIPYSRRSRRSI